MGRPIRLDGAADVSLSTDRHHFVQLNSDGEFFMHEIATRRVALSGRFVELRAIALPGPPRTLFVSSVRLSPQSS